MTPLNNPEFVDRVKAVSERCPRGTTYHVISATGGWTAIFSRPDAALHMADAIGGVAVAVIEGVPYLLAEVK